MSARPPADCPACGEMLRGWRIVPSGEGPDGLRPVALLRCVSCGTAVTATPAAPDVHEAGAYAADAPRLMRVAAPVLSAFDRRRVGFLRRAGVAPGAVVLDAGAGRGRFVAAARRAGFDARGFEPSERGVRVARSRYGVELERAGVLDADVPCGSVDAVVLWHVLEHLEPGDAGPALDRMRGWLRPGGVLLVGVPDLASFQARLAGRRWYHLDPPRHRIHFTAEGLRLLLARHGLAVQAEHHHVLEHNPFGLWQALVPAGRPAYPYHLLKRSAPVTARGLAAVAAALPLVPLAVAAEGAAGAARRGGTIAVVARRTDMS